MNSLPDPLEHAERIVREANDATGKSVQPVLRKYPLIFGLLITFSVAAVIHAIELLSDRVPLFEHHPSMLLVLGLLGLLFTGALYRKLDK
jgi:hypothetical protein